MRCLLDAFSMLQLRDTGLNGDLMDDAQQDVAGENKLDTEHVNLRLLTDMDKVLEVVLDQLVAREDAMQDAVPVNYKIKIAYSICLNRLKLQV